jgi:hypothetical protein
MFTGYLTILVERITVSQPFVAGLRASNSGALCWLWPKSLISL